MAELSVSRRRAMNEKHSGHQSDHVAQQTCDIPPSDLPRYSDDTDMSMLSGSKSDESINNRDQSNAAEIDAGKSNGDNRIDTAIHVEDTPQNGN
jgi:hypothetical protein